MVERSRQKLSDLLADLAQHERGLLLLQVLLAVILPTAISIAVNWYTGSDEEIKSVAGVVLAFFIVIQLLLLFASLAGPSTPARAIVALDELNNTYVDLEESYTGLKDQRDSYWNAVLCANSSLAVLRGLIDAGPIEVNHDTLRDHLKRLLEPYIIQKDDVFNFSRFTALYRVNVLLFDQKSETLISRYNYSDPGVVEQNRTWTPKTGHAGHAYTTGKVIITPDLQQVEEYKDHYNETDAAQYRSMASIPFFRAQTVCGVIVITASEPDQFRYENAVWTFETIGHILSLYLGYTTIQEV